MSSAELSKMLFDARESVEMLADITEALTGKVDVRNRQLVARIDRYRVERGWSRLGFGGEDDPPPDQG